ncbi:hypothetical protein DKX38_002952 [Salix brachista]|uniref:Calcineurin-like phosphoesterase domain-containing protein n=1 Tax=Salix brachista TaxID=2182728 RepID=A0A5N5NPM5_9ROSI|nr:hypothetical protein DKX38_002952 [Salix brachista]
MKRVRTGKGGIKEKGMRICICKEECGLVILRQNLIPKGMNLWALFMMLVPLLPPMVSLMSSNLMKAVPDDHKKFLAEMVWIHEEGKLMKLGGFQNVQCSVKEHNPKAKADDVCIEDEEGIRHCKLIAVHAGLEKGKNVGEQLRFLKAKETHLPKIEGLSGRECLGYTRVGNDSDELTEKPTIVVSGHHGKLHIEGLRLIIDEGGGFENKPVAAIALPSMKLVRDTDNLTK